MNSFSKKVYELKTYIIELECWCFSVSKVIKTRNGTSYPPEYIYECKSCGFKEYSMEDFPKTVHVKKKKNKILAEDIEKG